MTTKENLHRLVEVLPDGELEKAQHFLETLGTGNAQDPVLRAFLDAPYDDEPLTPEDQADIDEARAEIVHGQFCSWESVRAELLGQS